MSSISTSNTHDMMDVLTKHVDDQVRLTKYRADAGIKEIEQKVREELIAPYVSQSSGVLDIKA